MCALDLLHNIAPVLTVNEHLDGAKWKPTRWYCNPFDGGADYYIHVFPTLNE